MMNYNFSKLKAILLAAFCLLLTLGQVVPGQAGIWIRPSAVKQGEIIIVSGLFYDFSNASAKRGFSFLGDCSLKFEGETYNFYREIVSYEEFRNSGGTQGFQFITRLASTPLTTVGEKTITLNCPTGSEVFKVNIQAGNFPVQNIQLSASKNSLDSTEKEKLAVEAALKSKSPYRLWDSNKIWTLPNSARRSSVYGLRRTYNGKLAENYFHKGLDFAAFTGASIMAPAKGKVVLAGHEKDGFAVHGNCLFIDHGQGVVSSYLHLSEISVKEGQEVESGQLLGKVGDTGIATGPHLHFGIYVNGQNVNPDPWLQFAIP